jgi:hypothetical protein
MIATTEELENIKKQIEQMDKSHHVEILKILKQNNSITLNENKSGVYVNLSFLPENTLDDVKKYMKYINIQEDSIQLLETQQTNFKNTFFHCEQEYKDNALNYNSASN